MAKDYIFGFNPTKVPESFERPTRIPEFIHGPRPNIVPSQDNKVISYYEEIIRLKRAMDELQSELEAIIRTQIPDYDSTNANNVLSVNEDGTKMEWKPATSASGVSASVEQTATGATITITDASGTTTANVENGTDGITPNVSATATVNNTTGSPTVQVTKSGTDEAPTFNFDFSGIKGETGKGTKGDDGFSPIANVQQTDTGATITVTDKSGTTSATVKNGTKGDAGVTPSIAVTASVDNTTGTPSVDVTKTGTDEAPAFNFAFSGIKGETGEGTKGDDGFSPIADVQQTETGATITVTDKSGTTTATVENGTDGITPNVSATATVNDSQGTPSVEVTKSGTNEAPSFNFAFSGIKGETGEGTKGDDGFSPIANVQQTETGATITVTDKSGTTTATVENGTPGPGIPTGGIAGQVLTKVDGTDYNTEWKNPSGGGGAVKSIEQEHLTFYPSTDTITLAAGAQTALRATSNINYNSFSDFYITTNFQNDMYKDTDGSSSCPFVIISANAYGTSDGRKVAVSLTILNVSNSSVTAYGAFGSKPSLECDLIVMRK